LKKTQANGKNRSTWKLATDQCSGIIEGEEEIQIRDVVHHTVLLVASPAKNRPLKEPLMILYIYVLTSAAHDVATFALSYLNDLRKDEYSSWFLNEI